MVVLNPNAAAVSTIPGMPGGLLQTEWQALMAAVIAQLGGTGWPKWPAPGQPLPWYPTPAAGWSADGGADGKPRQPLATETVTVQQFVDCVRALWPATLNGKAFPAPGSTRTLTVNGQTVTATVTLDGHGVQAAAKTLGLEF